MIGRFLRKLKSKRLKKGRETYIYIISLFVYMLVLYTAWKLGINCGYFFGVFFLELEIYDLYYLKTQQFCHGTFGQIKGFTCFF